MSSLMWWTISAQDRPKMGGAEQVGNRIDIDSEEKSGYLKPWYELSYGELKKRIEDDIGLSIGLDYTTAFFFSNATTNTTRSSGGMLRLYGSWSLVNRNSSNEGSFVFKVEQRHKYSETALSDYAKAIGYVGFIESPFSDKGLVVTNLYWVQNFFDDRLMFWAGFLDATDYVDMWRLSSAWQHFTHNSFSNGADLVTLPSEGSIGFSLGGWLSDHWYAMASFQNQISDPSQIFDGFSSIDQGEYFKHIELGFAGDPDFLLLDNFHFSAWHKNANTTSGSPEGYGAMFSVNKKFADQLMPFVRAGYNKGGGSPLQTSLAAGFSVDVVKNGDLCGLGYVWSKTNPDTYNGLNASQHVIEFFYRFQITNYLYATPNLQFIGNPALNPNDQNLFVYGIRGRLAL